MGHGSFYQWKWLVMREIVHGKTLYVVDHDHRGVYSDDVTAMAMGEK